MVASKAGGVYQLLSDVKSNSEFSWFVPLFLLSRDATAEEMARVTAARTFLATTAAKIVEADGSTDLPHTAKKPAATDIPDSEVPF